MSYDGELPTYLENAELIRFQKMNAKFCARMHAAIAQGLESAPVEIVTTPGTKHPKCVTNQIERYDLSRDDQ